MDGHQDDKCPDKLDEGDKQILRPVVGKLRYIKEVPRHTGHQLSCLVIVKEGTGQPLQLTEKVSPHICLHIGTHNVPLIAHIVVEPHLDKIHQDKTATQP